MPQALQAPPRPAPRRRGWAALAPAGRPAAPLRVARPMGPLDPEQHEEQEQQAAIRERLQGYWRLVRGWNALPSMALVLLGAWTGAGKTLLALKHLTVWFMGLASGAVAMASCTINDYFDADIDAVNDPQKPVPSGLIPRDRALLVAALLYIGLLALACLVPNAGVRLIVALSSALTVLYTPVLKKQTLVKNCVVACVIAAAPLAGALAAGAGGGPGLRAVLAPCAFLWLGIMFREIMMDIQDRCGDGLAGVLTLPVVLGPRAALGIGFGLLAACMALAAHAAVYGSGLAWAWAAAPTLEPAARSAALAAVAWVLSTPCGAALAVQRTHNGNGAKQFQPVRVNERGIVVDDGQTIPFKKLMAANRGEIAVRITRAGIELGLTTLAIYSEADRLQPHRFKADESYEVGSSEMTPVQAYLDVPGIVRLAKEQGVDVIHPGYGFLSENAAFARECQKAGITFVGPLPETIEAMGDKTAARRLAVECGVPVVPGTNDALESAEQAKAFAREAGYPVILKARSGGGGRGMRVVHSEEEMEDNFVRASNEAKAAFGDGGMFIEKYLEDPRHIEIQILADNHGNVVHLYERDCSVQRRHQKVVEMAPAPGLDEGLRQALFDDAVKLAKHVGYRNAGTVEFIVDKHGKHYYMETNPRIQVEHTVTEEITGIDLVQSQIRIAGGATLAQLGLGSQADVPKPNGYAIQCRVTSEDPERNFQPDSGRITAYRSPGGHGIRLDGAMAAGNIVSRHYDSLLVKVICKAPTFMSAVQKMQRALYEFHIRGIKTNILFLENVLRHPEFLSGEATTSFIDRNPELFQLNQKELSELCRLLEYLAEQKVNGPKHPGAIGAPPAKVAPAPVPLPHGSDPHIVPAGWKDYLDKQGPEAWAKAVREHRQSRGVLITDTTMRDAHQSLLATRMRTHDMLKAAPATAHILANAGSLEVWGGATFDVALRFLHECPWRRLELLRERIPNVPFQMLLRGANAVGYTSYPDNACFAFVDEAKKAGVDIFRVFDSLNDIDQLRFGIDTVARAGGVIEGTLCYTGDVSNPRASKYTLEYYLNLAEKMVEHGIHALAIKDMAGLLKPRAATMLVGALRERFPDLPIHVHTHDTAGTGVATQLAAAAAGADIIDCAIDSMSGTTSQPSMGAIVNSLAGTDLDTGIDPEAIQPLIDYWDQARLLYAPFESNLYCSSSDVYRHEMPGGQYTNLKFQATTLGLGSEWERVKTAYAAANRALGDIVKVTPSSKVVGDLAQFMVSNNLDEHSLVEQAETLSLPSSVVEFLQGYLGTPVGGFPEPLRSRVLKDKPIVQGRPGASMAPLDIRGLESQLKEKHPAISYRDVMSAAMYPKVFEEYKTFTERFSRHVEKLPTRAFLAPLDIDEEIDVELTKGNKVSIKLKAIGELQPSGMREVFFEYNGIPRVVEVREESKAASDTKKAARDKADSSDPGSVGAPMAGEIIEVKAKPGSYVKAGQALVVMSAMKMETTVAAPASGTVSHVAVIKGDQCDTGDLLVLIKPGEPNGSGSNGSGTADAKPLAGASS
ncbi:pyruvate carboxylase isoform A [Chlorella sorokiniana]|uniref:Pyruvate carboxylase isoform A n=1 Tax=Chlorella sorokiniana TaxID=3076 RepID=A0A2P6TD09_CHLSO|nr:pyruvate carboxylase isoform A [Chlorella sorokiniana]|eukprot:PRW20525.1 pyruvate carboxylase isoform A [Chlorella sorokiniana]